MKTIEFTCKIKKDWLIALKSGEYTQCKGILRIDAVDSKSEKVEHCCLGVLNELSPEGFKDDYKYFINKLFDGIIVSKIYTANDNNTTFPKAKDYSNVIPIIEKLKCKS